MPRKTRISLLALLLALLVCAPLFSSCSRAPKVEELRADVAALLEAAPEINEVFFGAGLPILDRSAPENAELYRYSVPESMSLYDVVDTAHAKFTSIDHIKAAALRVYSPACIAPLFASAFEGVSSDANPSSILVSKSYFVEQDGLLYQLRRSELDPDFDAIRDRSLVFDFDSLRVNASASSQTSVSLSISAHLLSDPAKTETKTFRITSTTSGWKLGSWVL